MFCKFCGAELPDDARFCPKCGKDNGADAAAQKPTRSLGTLDMKTLLFAVGVVAVVLLTVLLVRSCGAKDAAPERQAEETVEPEPEAPIVGKWTNADGVGVTFTEDGYMRFTAGNISLGYDKFHYEITGENTLTLTPDVPVLGTAISYDANYALAGDTLFLGVGDYDFTLVRK